MFSQNIYIKQITTMSNNTKYLKWYLNIIMTAKLRSDTRKVAKQLLGYTELHHVVPKCFCVGSSSSFAYLSLEKDHKDNLVYLSAREHFICHMLLVKMLISDRHRHAMSPALTRLKHSRKTGKYFNSRTYETAKVLISKYHHNKIEENKVKLRTPRSTKNKTYEEIYGEEAAKKLREQRSLKLKGKNNSITANPRFDHTIYTFYNIETEETFISTRYDFYTTFKLRKSALSEMVRNRNKIYKNWTIIGPNSN